MDFHNFYTIYVFKVKESTADISTELSCLSDLENPSQLPVWKVLMIQSYKLLKFSDYSCFRGQGIHCWYFYRVTWFELPRKSRSTSGLGYLKGTDNCILWIFTISSLFMFSRSRNPLMAFLLSYDVCVTLIIQVNFRFERYWWFCLMNFWNFHTIHIFEIRESIADISTELPCLGNLENLGKLPVQDVLGGTGECVL